MAIEDRPASCTTTRAIVIVDGKPTPRKLRARSGVCLYWGNKSSGRVRVEQLPAPGVRLQAPTDWFVMPAGTVHGLGPYETLAPREFRQVLRDEGGKFGCTTIRSESHYGARYYASTGRPVRIPLRTHPGGGRVELRIEPSPEREALARDVRAVRRLRCGRRAVDARPVRCRRPRAVTIVNGKPLPAELRIRRRTDCVVWGNRGKRQVTIDSQRCPRCFFTLPLPPRSAGVNYFGAAAPKRFPHPVRYGIKPGGTSGTILLEDD
jgi:hypothetical protein